MPAPAAAVAVPVIAESARKAGKTVMDVVTSDLVVIRTQTTRGRGKKKKPVDLEFHINPAALGLTAVGAGLALWLAQLRLKPVETSDGKVVGVTLASRAGFGIDGVDTASYLSPILSPTNVAIAGSPIAAFLRYLKLI